MTLPLDNYGIRPDYAAHTANATVGAGTDGAYWSDYQVRMARHYQFPVYQVAGQLARRYSVQSVLDIGCGPGSKLAEVMAPICKRIVGLDDAGALAHARALLPDGRFLAYDIERDSFPLSETFDLIISADVIEHLVSPDKLLDDIRQASSPETHIILSTPERDGLRGPDCLMSPKAVHVREWNKREFAAYIRSRGFAIREHRVLPPLRFNWSRAYFTQRLSQLRNGRPFDTCQMIVCQKTQ